MHDDVAVVRCLLGCGEANAERCRHRCTRRVDIDKAHLGPRYLPCNPRHEAADGAGADDCDTIARLDVRVPHTVDCCLGVRRQHGASGRHIVWQHVQRGGRDDKARLVWKEREHQAAHEFGRPCLNLADVAVAVLHRRWKIARLERRAHALTLGLRHASAEDQRLGAAADAAVAGADDGVGGCGEGQRFVVNRPMAGCGDPECPGLFGCHCPVFSGFPARDTIGARHASISL